jgi:hypothetical protein
VSQLCWIVGAFADADHGELFSLAREFGHALQGRESTLGSCSSRTPPQTSLSLLPYGYKKCGREDIQLGYGAQWHGKRR